MNYTEDLTLDQLTEEQAAVVASVFDDRRNVCVTGPAGSGKSAVLKALTRYAQEKRERFQVVGTTGIAAVNINGITLHAFAGLPVNNPALTPEKLAKAIENSDRYEQVFTNLTMTKILAIDEVSMLSAQLLDYFSELCQLVRGNPEPFGGMRIVFFGDFLQLPPVGNKDNRNPPFAFESEHWYKANIRLHLLTKVFRQPDPEYANFLSKLRRGIYDADCQQRIAALTAKPIPRSGKAVIIHTHNKDVDNINQKFLAQLTGRAEIFQAADQHLPNVGEKALKEIQKSCLAVSPLELRVGARVMLLRNTDFHRGLINGSCGTLVDFKPFGGEKFKLVPVVEFDNGETEAIKPASWETIDGEERVIAARTQIPLRIAYAITAHKSQGLTLNSTVLFLNRCFNFGQGYVALSRCKTAEHTYLNSYNKRSFMADKRAQRFYLNPQVFCGEQ